MRLMASLLTTAALFTTQPTAFRVQVAGHGRPMILIPGLSSSGDTWKGTVEHFKDRFTTGDQPSRKAGRDPAIEVHPVVSTPQRYPRLKVAHLGLKRGDLGLGNIGRVRYD